MATNFTEVYDRFFDKITDDMYIEYTQQDTEKDCQSLLINAIPCFEFPRKSLSYVKQEESAKDTSYFVEDLSNEEINILSSLMVTGWLQRQITSIDNTRQQYYGNSFKLTSQAAHLNALIKTKEEMDKTIHKLQRLYNRREIGSDGKVTSRWTLFNTYKQ